MALCAICTGQLASRYNYNKAHMLKLPYKWLFSRVVYFTNGLLLFILNLISLMTHVDSLSTTCER